LTHPRTAGHYPPGSLLDENPGSTLSGNQHQDQGATPNIPHKSNRRRNPRFGKRLYRERNLIERFFSKLKHFRHVATRYDKLPANFLAMTQLASIRLWLRVYKSTA
jgi:transposase